MARKQPTTYRTIDLPDLGRITLPSHMTEADLKASLATSDGNQPPKNRADTE